MSVINSNLCLFIFIKCNHLGALPHLTLQPILMDTWKIEIKTISPGSRAVVVVVNFILTRRSVEWRDVY